MATYLDTAGFVKVREKTVVCLAAASPV